MQIGAQQEALLTRNAATACVPSVRKRKPSSTLTNRMTRYPNPLHAHRPGVMVCVVAHAVCSLGSPRSDACSGARSSHDRRASLPRARVAGRAARVLRDAGRRGPEPRVNGSGDRRCAGTKLATIDTYGGRCGPAGARRSRRRARPNRMGRQHHIAERARAEPILDHARQRPSLAATARGALHTACRPTGADLPEQVWPTTPSRRGERLHPSRARPLIPAAVYPLHRA